MFGHVTKRLSAFCHGELPAEEMRQIEAHVARCTGCRRELEEIRLGVALASHLERVPAPETLWSSIETELRKDSAPAEDVQAPAWMDWRAWGAVAAVLLLGIWLAVRWMPREPELPRRVSGGTVTAPTITPVVYDLGDYLRPVQASSGATSFQRISSAPPKFVEQKREEKFPLEWLNRLINGPEDPLPGYKLQSARTGAADGAPIVQLVYNKGAEKAFSVFIAPKRVEFKFGAEYAYEAEVGGVFCKRVDCPLQRTFEFGEGGVKCVLVTKWVDDATAAHVMKFFLNAYRDTGTRAAPLPAEPKPAAQPAAQLAADETKQARLLKIGEKLFVARCGSCHDADGSKPLPTGAPLNQRTLSDEVVAKNVEPRLKTASDEEKRAIAAYIRNFLKHRPS
jgi:mono/diheme cytochrome c family protein